MVNEFSKFMGFSLFRVRPRLDHGKSKGSFEVRLGFHAEAVNGAASNSTTLKDNLETHLANLLPAAHKKPETLSQAIRHAVLSPGKRIRPMLCLMVNDASGGGDADLAMDCAAAIEFIHAASLILDDLPCMDDADLRRGRQTTHREFGESTAILAAIGLINLAFSAVTRTDAGSSGLRLKAAAILAETNGANGLAAGQVLDLAVSDTPKTEAETEEAEIEEANWLKTGVLFVAAAELGAIAGGLSQSRIDHVKVFARHLGLAFQTRDDILDQICTSEAIGKDVRQDEGHKTVVTLDGVDAATAICREHMTAADSALGQSGLASNNINFLVQSVFRDLVQD